MIPQRRFMWLVQSRRYVNRPLTSPNTEKLQYCIEHCGHEYCKSCIKFLHTYRCASYSSCLYDVYAMENFIHQLLHWELNSAAPLTHSVNVHLLDFPVNVHSCNFRYPNWLPSYSQSYPERRRNCPFNDPGGGGGLEDKEVFEFVFSGLLRYCNAPYTFESLAVCQR